MSARSTTGPAIEIRAAKHEDLSVLASLFDRYRVFYERASDIEGARHFVRDRLDDRESTFFVALSDGTIAGFSHLSPTFETLNMRRGWMLEDIFVDSNYRRRGVGSALLDRSAAFARSTGASKLTLTTAHTNVTAQKVYVAHGYILDEVFRTYTLDL